MAGEYIEFNNSTQPAVNDTNLNLLQQLIKQDMHSAVSGDTLPIGAIMPFGSNTIPENWLLCDGSAVSRTTYQYLFNTIGTTYGTGDGFTTFNLPDLRGKVVVGLDSNDTSFDVLGETGGEKEHTLTVQEMPSHNHILTNGDNNIISEGENGTTAGITTTGQGYRKVKLATTGGGQAHNILQPYIIQNYIIKADQSSGVLATVVNNLTSTSSTDALSANQGKVLKELLEGTVLYENSTGTSGTVTLSQNITNFKRIKISGFATQNNNFYFCQEFEVHVNEKTGLVFKTYDSSTYYYMATESLTLNTNSITRGSQKIIGLSGGGNLINDEAIIYITKVVGYDY